jgi:polyphosphate kinase
MTETGSFELDTSFTTNRELSWLKFNERVLQVGNDVSVPLLERLKFVAIFVSNLDEFFMIRVGSLFDLSSIDEAHIDNKSGMTIREQLDEIFKAATPLYKKKDASLLVIEKQLEHFGIVRLDFKNLAADEKKYIDGYFTRVIFPVLSPQVVDMHHPFPHIENKSLNIAVMLKSKDESKFGIIPVPKMLDRIVFLKNGLARFILVEDIILKYAEKIFEMYEVEEKSVISVTRNADLNPDDETYDFDEDFRYHMKKILKKRARLSPVRLEASNGNAKSLIAYLAQRLAVDKAQIFQSATPLEMSYVYALEDQLPLATKRAVTYVPYIPQYPTGINLNESVLKQATSKDLLLSYPYESMEPFLQLVKEAAADPAVISIKITLYRLDRKSRLAQYLIDAAENNKDVTVIMELRARFDEQNNIEWAERLEEAGCKVIYGFKGFKVHSKVCLITRHDKGRLQYVTQIGTGNYNEKTARLYADFSLITARESIGSDANSFFKNMLISNLEGRYKQLLIAPTYLKTTILSHIDAEIRKAHEGRPCGIIMKMNSLTDRETLDKLSEASCAGVKIRLIIRGICCIIPGIPGKTENITVTSVIGRFLEHSRVYCFGSGAGMKMLIASADLMTRNTERRIEIACPVLDKAIRTRILGILQTQLAENVKSWRLGQDGNYRVEDSGGGQLNCQEIFMKEAMKAYELEEPQIHAQARAFVQRRFGRIRDRVWDMMPKKDKEKTEE